MAAINLKITELRKKQGMTQQELGEKLGVSFQTISKWENSITLPDLTMIPDLCECFHVSTDELLGLIPLKETYRPSASGTKEYWAERVEYLKSTREGFWNQDYLEFLVQKVWKINEPVNVLDCGCGFGYMGLQLFKILPDGSTYTGIDFSAEMIEAGRRLFELEGINAQFICEDFNEMKLNKKYELVIGQAFLRHVNYGENFLRKMTEAAADGGLVVSVEGNREFEADGLYLEGMDYAGLCSHDGFNKLWKKEYENQGRDYSIAMKIPHFMRKLGLSGIGTRMNDRITYLAPDSQEYEKLLQCIVKEKQWDQEKSQEETEAVIGYFMNHGMTRKEAYGYCRQQNEIVSHFKEYAGDTALTMFRGLIISYGWKNLQI